MAGVLLAADDRRVTVATTTQAQVVEGVEVAAELVAPGQPFAGLAFSADGSMLLAAPHRYDLEGERWLPPIEPPAPPRHSGSYVRRAAMWDSTGSVLLEASEFRRGRGGGGGGNHAPGRVRRVTSEGGSVLLEDLATAVAVGADGTLIAAGVSLWVWDGTGALRTSLSLSGGAAKAVAVADHRLAVVSSTATVTLVDIVEDGLLEVASWRAHDEAAMGIAWVRGHIVTVGWEGAVRLWDATGDLVDSVPPPDDLANGYAVTADPGGAVFVSLGGAEAGVYSIRVEGT